MTPPPRLPDTALYGLAGETVKYTAPYTEASGAAILFTFLASAGTYLGGQPHMFAGDAIHPARLWPLIVGPTSNGMKGTSWNVVTRIIEQTDPAFAAAHTASGLSTAEGLIEQVRDANGTDPEADGFDEGITDKRLMVIESEFAAVLGRARREGNVLSPVLRDVWDGKRLQTMTRKVNALTASGHHISVIGHITPTELIAKLTDSDMAGGLVNRFLPCWSIRSKKLPDGGGTPPDVLEYLAAGLTRAKDQTRRYGRMQRTPGANRLWHSFYDELTPDDLTEGPIAWVSARAVPQVIRLSTAYALLDSAREIDEVHLIASLACWEYVKATVGYVFGGAIGNPDLGKLMEYVDGFGIQGVTRTHIAKDLFRNHKTRAQLDALMDALIEMEEYESAEIPTAGRPKTVVRRRPPEQSSLWDADGGDGYAAESA
ncbi:hypothetical protein [Actinomadura sp. GTD37]|uniref:hypothetical protein n=1 Tax=Actinomadura sp. GTD37 TaxID=1778030 RepID=UPI0035C01907